MERIIRNNTKKNEAKRGCYTGFIKKLYEKLEEQYPIKISKISAFKEFNEKYVVFEKQKESSIF